MQTLDYEKDVSAKDKELFKFHTMAKFIQFCKESGIEDTPETFGEYLERELSVTVFLQVGGVIYYFIPKRLS